MPHKRTTVLVSALVACVVLALLLPPAAKLLLFDTEYAPGFEHSRFAHIREGDSVDSVLSTLGQPLHVLKWDQGAKEKRWTVPSEDLHSDLDQQRDVYIRYSAPGSKSDHYRAYEICFSNGVVAQVRRYDYWD